jgi:ribosome-associated protein
MIEVTDAISLEDDELIEKFVRASGPGGQHVNKTSTAVELRFDVRGSPSLPEDVKTRLEALAGSRLTGEGVLIIFAQTHSAQQMNRQDARARLFDLIRQRATKPTKASKLRRLETKTRRAGVKSLRGRPADD